MKRVLCCVLSLMLLLSLVACGGSGTNEKGIYTPGTYTAAANGMGKVTVTITVDSNKITDVKLDLSGETDSIGQAAGEDLKSQVLTAQSGEIDGVSGATVTSTAVKTAVTDCLTQAKG